MLPDEASATDTMALDAVHWPERSPATGDRYRIGFILNTAIGNMTRYQNLRKYSERVTDIECHWAPVNYYTQKRDRPWWAPAVPEAVYGRSSLVHQFWPVFSRYRRLDAVMIHLFEADILSILGRNRWPDLLRISSTDDAPVVDPSTYPLYPAQIARAEWRKKLRLKIDLWRAHQTDFFVPLSDWVGDLLVNDCGVEMSKVHPVHVGVDLETWRYRPQTVVNLRPKILFVGSEFERKGGLLLLDVFSREFSGSAELHIVSGNAPAELPPNVFVYKNLKPNDGLLSKLYEEADVVVVPTTADTGPLWVYLEALATGRPVIGTLTGANAEVVLDGETGFAMPIGDGARLTSALRRLLGDPQLRARFGARGRCLVEERFDSSVNVPRLFDTVKAEIESRRQGRS